MEGHDRIFLDAAKWHSKYPLSARSRKEFIQLAMALATVEMLRSMVASPAKPELAPQLETV